MNILPNLQKLKSPIVFLKLTPKKQLYATRKTDNIPSFNLRHNLFKNFFPSTNIEWSNLDPILRNL